MPVVQEKVQQTEMKVTSKWRLGGGSSAGAQSRCAAISSRSMFILELFLFDIYLFFFMFDLQDLT